MIRNLPISIASAQPRPLERRCQALPPTAPKRLWRRLWAVGVRTLLAGMAGGAVTPSNAANPNTAAPEPTATQRYAVAFQEALARGLPSDGVLLLVSVPAQRLSVIEAGRPSHTYQVSTSDRGVGAQSGSYRTPPGWHRVAERFGGRERPGRVFVARRPTDRLLRYHELRSDADEDLVVTRILWLEGLEPGVNRGGAVDSYLRYIYLHGTNQEHRLGTPASRGCIRLSNRDILELFELTEGRETWCRIDP